MRGIYWILPSVNEPTIVVSFIIGIVFGFIFPIIIHWKNNKNAHAMLQEGKLESDEAKRLLDKYTTGRK
uniref:Uncharacterized protein n=1 Tax=Caenorhabditis japonica TaxID=281687 RepID=A0A8R1I506_CAEJA